MPQITRDIGHFQFELLPAMQFLTAPKN